MSDERLRALERRFRETGVPEDEAAWLVARRRSGELPEDRLRLAAHLGHGPARTALSELEDPFDWRASETLALAAWARKLVDWGQEACYRAALAASGAALKRWNAAGLPPVPAPSLRLIESWVGPGKRPRNKQLRRVISDSSLPPFVPPTVGIALSPGSLAENVERAVVIAASYPGTTTALNAIREEVLPWSLGYGDPVRMRVAKRGETKIWAEDLEE